MRDAAVTLPAGGNGDSVGASVSPDGRFVVFTSAASDLVPGDNRQFNTDVYLRDRASNTTTLVSVNLAGTGGGNSHSLFGQVSTNGRYVLFESDASDLVAGDTNASTDIFVRDLQTGTTRLVSETVTGGIGIGRSDDAVMTPDGRFVAFVSSVSNLVSGDTNRIPDVFVRDLKLNTNWLVSVGAAPGGREMATPQITPDGRYVAFFSSATGMVASASPSINGEVYVRDLVDNTTTWASADGLDLLQATFGISGATNSAFCHPSISSNGRYIAFLGGTNRFGRTLVLVFDQVAGTTSLVATNGVGAFPMDDDRSGPEMTPDGRFIAYVKGEVDGTNSNVYVWDSMAETSILVSGDSSGVPADAISDSPVITSNGQSVAFLSNATNLVGYSVSCGFHVYLRDLQAGTTQLADADTNNAGSTDVVGTFPSLSEDSQFVVFNSPDGRLVGGDNNRVQDVFLRDTIGGTNELISQRRTAVPDTGYRMTRMASCSVSADGRWVAFESFANDLVPDDTNNWCDIFVRDLWTGQTTLIRSPVNVVSNVNPYAWSPAISGDGRYVAYVRALYNGKTTGNMESLNIFRWDRLTGSNILVSVSRTNLAAPVTGDCSDPLISSDGRYVAYLSSASDLVYPPSNGLGTVWRDMEAATNVLLSSGGASPSRFLPSMSADGRFVAYQSASQLRIRDTRLGTDIYTNSATITSAAISPDGSRVLYCTNALYPSSSTWVNVDQIAPRSNLLSFASTVSVQSSGQWSCDGRYVVFVGGTTQPLDKSKVYLRDLATGNLTLISRNATDSGTPNGPSDMPVICGNGQFVAYRSYATDIVAGDTNPAPKIFLYNRLTGANSILCAAQHNPEPSPWISGPVISAGAENVAFVSVGSDLVANDFNRVSDAFAVRVLIRMQITATPSPGGTATLSWQTVPQRNYGVQYRDELADPQWHDLPASISIVGNLGSVTLPADQPDRFYRVIETE